MTNIKALLPDRHPQPDFFVCDIFDSVPTKSDTPSMEFPLFTLSTKPDMDVKPYKKGDKWVTVSPSPYGRATVHDRDVLIYCISQCMAALNKGEKIQKKLRFQAMDMLTVTNRRTSGEGYKLLKMALRRLQGTQLETNIETGGKENWKVFSFIDDAEIIRETREGKMLEIEITLSDWIFNAIDEKAGDILTIHRNYFRLRKPLERRLYELARKHCGTKNDEWKFTIEELHERTGSKSNPREFKRMLLAILKNSDHIPDYTFTLKGNVVYIYPKDELKRAYRKPKPIPWDGYISASAFEKLATMKLDTDKYALEREFREWITGKGITPKNPDAMFLDFAKKRQRA